MTIDIVIGYKRKHLKVDTFVIVGNESTFLRQLDDTRVIVGLGQLESHAVQ